jgi:AcrR family transcriptional regulator
MQRDKAKSQKRRANQPKPYHHGALRAALIEATDEILQERGIEGFSLREAARRVGVSPAAPVHHFGSTAGLLTEIAISAYRDLTRYLREAQGSEDPRFRLHAQGVGYVRFALRYPGRFKLMFHRGLLLDDARLTEAADAAYGELEKSVRAYLGITVDAPLDVIGEAMRFGAWSIVHGFAHLVLEGRLNSVSGSSTGAVEQMLPVILAKLLPRRTGAGPV